MGRSVIYPLRLWVGVALALAALACAGGWLATRHRNAWNTPGIPWPRYAALHFGQVTLFSTLWRADRSGTHAWESKDWMYDSLGGPTSGWIIRYRRIGDSYGGTPPYVTTMHALFIPLWYPAVPLALWSGSLIRRARREAAMGRCARCGYSLMGLPTGAPRPECGPENASVSPPS